MRVSKSLAGNFSKPVKESFLPKCRLKEILILRNLRYFPILF